MFKIKIEECGSQMEEFIVSDDIYDRNGILILSKGHKLLLDDINKMKLSKFGVLDKVLNMKRDEETKFSDLSTKKRNEIRHNQESWDEKEFEVHKPVLDKSIQAIASKLPTLDKQSLLKATEVASNLIFRLRDENWYSHFKVLTNRVDWLYAHSVNTTIISAVIGVHLGYSDKRLKELALGALLHDIGMILLPTKILNKAGELTENEMSMIQNHSELGYEMLKDTELSEISKKTILQHHEKNDGSGYPNGITSIDILEEAKIVMIAEAFDTATTQRPYQETISAKMVLDQMIGSPQIYEARLVEILNGIIL